VISGVDAIEQEVAALGDRIRGAAGRP